MLIWLAKNVNNLHVFVKYNTAYQNAKQVLLQGSSSGLTLVLLQGSSSSTINGLGGGRPIWDGGGTGGGKLNGLSEPGGPGGGTPGGGSRCSCPSIPPGALSGGPCGIPLGPPGGGNISPS